jgi:hypothetical protein
VHLFEVKNCNKYYLDGKALQFIFILDESQRNPFSLLYFMFEDVVFGDFYLNISKLNMLLYPIKA